jgi:hypothetical protein
MVIDKLLFSPFIYRHMYFKLLFIMLKAIKPINLYLSSDDSSYCITYMPSIHDKVAPFSCAESTGYMALNKTA